MAPPASWRSPSPRARPDSAPGEAAHLDRLVASGAIRPSRPGGDRSLGRAGAGRCARCSDLESTAALGHRRRRPPARRGAAEPRHRHGRPLRRNPAALPELEHAARQRFHQCAVEQFRLRHRGQSRPDGGQPRRSRPRAARLAAADGKPAAAAVDRYLDDKVVLPTQVQLRANCGVDRAVRRRPAHRPQGRDTSEVSAPRLPRPNPCARASSRSCATRRRSIACKG